MYFNSVGIKIVQNCLIKMDEDHIKLLAKQCHQVILMKKKENNKNAHFWKIQDRGYAAQLLARFVFKLCHSILQHVHIIYTQNIIILSMCNFVSCYLDC